MPRPQASSYRCSGCGSSSAKWYGRCPKCGEFSTLAEVTASRDTAASRAPARPARPVREIGAGGPIERLRTGVGEFDRVVGGGLVPGQVCLCSGPPGSGKSTLLLAVADSVAQRLGRPVLYVSGEESVEQIALRARRIGARSEHLLLADDTDLEAVLGHLDAHAPALALAVIDSVQTLSAPGVEGRPGGVTQVMEVAQALTRAAKSRGLPMLLVGQVTKDSNVAGPRALEHIVDTTLSLDGDKHTSLRLLRTVKNRFGSLEVAAFEQTETGLREVLDPSSLFREHREEPVPGTCATVTIEGHRALTAEIQSLVAANVSPNPRRAVSGLDSARSAMLIAVCERSTGLRLHERDVYLATVAGMRIVDPGTDLAVCLAIISAVQATSVPLDLLAVGEVALSGDIRPVPMLGERVAEAVRLGFRDLIVPTGTRARLDGRATRARLHEVRTLEEASRLLAAPSAAAASSAQAAPTRATPSPEPVRPAAPFILRPVPDG
jgi:DNA repair protein RadA/Sms